MSQNASKRPSRKSELEDFTPATPQEQLPPITVSLKELFNERHRYTIYPPFQRQEVWPLAYSRAYIDSILLGDPSPAVEGYQEYSENGEIAWGIIDGHQRITAILDFMDGKYKTWTIDQKRQLEPGSDPPVEPGKFYEELSVIARNYFLDYRLQINKVRKRSERQMITRFLRIQNHIPLSAAEKLHAHPSKARDAAKRIEQHAFWDDFYEGKTHREQKFQSSLYLLALEMTSDGILNLQEGTFIHGLAMGKYDDAITEVVIRRALSHLDTVSHVYAETRFTMRATIIPMFQSVLFLEQSGYKFKQEDKGRLTAWISALIAESNRSSGPAYNRPINRLLRGSAQQEFWEKHLKTVKMLFGIN